MIRKQITLDFGKIARKAGEPVKDGRWELLDDEFFTRHQIFGSEGSFYHEKTFTVGFWTNAGKVSKQDDDWHNVERYELHKHFEEAFQAAKAIEDATETDQARARELVEIINSADFSVSDDDLVTVEAKTSASKWYRSRAGEHNMRSQYFKLVPSAVAAEAKELKAIKDRHADNPKFESWNLDYRYVEKRDADHENLAVHTDDYRVRSI